MKIITLAISLISVVQAFGIEDTTKNRMQQAERYLTVVPPREMFSDMVEQVSQTIPPENRLAFRKAFTEYLDVDALTEAMTDAMVKNFTADELSALADFYGSADGKSAMKKFGAYMADVMPTVQAEVMRVVTMLNQDMEDGIGGSRSVEPTAEGNDD